MAGPSRADPQHAAVGLSVVHAGSCLCGAVSFEVSAVLSPPAACHCVQCRKQSGHYFAATEVARSDLRIRGDGNLRWYRSSATARRGFCSMCGSFLFWDAPAADVIEIAMGAFDTPTHSPLARHIFVAEKGDYYDIADGLPQNPR